MIKIRFKTQESRQENGITINNPPECQNPLS